jgi:hypothetical protein
MSLYKVAQLNEFREISHCTACVHFSGCAVWLSLLLMNEELGHPGLDIIVPDITKPCPMFFPWTSEAARKYEREVADR